MRLAGSGRGLIILGLRSNAQPLSETEPVWVEIIGSRIEMRAAALPDERHFVPNIRRGALEAAPPDHMSKDARWPAWSGTNHFVI